MPGYVWAPAWVAWRSDNDYTGWAPLPPDDRFLAGDETEFDIDPVAYYGPRFDAGTIFIFVGTRHMAEPNFRRYGRAASDCREHLQSQRATSRAFRLVNDHIVNRSIDVRVVERVSRRPIPTLSIHAVLRPGAIITNVHVGREIEVRERTQHPRETPPGNNHDNNNNGNNNGHNDNGNKNGHGDQDNNGMNGSPTDTDHGGATHNGKPDDNGGVKNNGATDQTPGKHPKDNGASEPTKPTTGGNTTPTDNGANKYGHIRSDTAEASQKG